MTDAARSLDRLWLATTDADSRVPVDWLDRQLRYAAQGWDAVAGTVRVESWRDRPGWMARVFESVHAPRDGHDHVYGANLGVHAPAYLRCGGMPPVACGEDRALVRALVRSGYAVRRAADLPVVTSARRDPRAAGGFGHDLSALREPTAS